MTLHSEFNDIFTQWNNKARYDVMYNMLLKWLSKYKNIVKDQDSIEDILCKIYAYDMNQQTETIMYISTPNLKKDLCVLVEDIVYGQMYQSLRDELLD
jgi:hypothetical protein